MYNQWLKAIRITWNRALFFVTNAWKNEKRYPSQKELRSLFVNNDSLINEYKWMLNVPYDVRDAALTDLFKAFESGKAKFKKDQKPFKVKPKTYNGNQSFWVHKKHWNTKRKIKKGSDKQKGFLHPTFTKECGIFKTKEVLPEKLNHDTHITKEGKRWFLIVSYEMEKRQNIVDDTIAFDPGTRTFLNGYSPNGHNLSIGHNCKDWFKTINIKMDDIRSEIDTSRDKRRRYRLRKRYQNYLDKIDNRIKDIHKKTVNYLCLNYSQIIIPQFGAKDMVKQKTIRSRTKRDLMMWAHGLFRQRLMFKAKQYGINVYVMENERGTTMVCDECGFIKRNVGSNETYKCDRCLCVSDRDDHASRGMIIKFLTENQ